MVICAISQFLTSHIPNYGKKVSNFAVSKERIVLSCIKKLGIMKFTVNRKEEALLNEIDFGFMRSSWFDSSEHVLTLTGTEVRQVFEDLFDVIPLNFDKEEL